MRLLKILATCGVLQIAHAGFVDKARHAKSMGPEHKPPALSLLSVLQPVNATHVDVSITNSYSEHISILSWNNLLQTNQHAAYGSFKLSRAFSNGSIQQLGRGSNTGYYHSPETFSSHFVNITARGAYANTFDLTKLFSILEAGTYNVTMDFTSPAALVANETDFSNMLQKAKSGTATFEAMSMPHVRIKSGTLSVNLQASSASQTNRKRTGTTVEACSTQPQASAAVVRARGYARSLAKYSQQYVLPPLGIAAHGVSTPFLEARQQSNRKPVHSSSTTRFGNSISGTTSPHRMSATSTAPLRSMTSMVMSPGSRNFVIWTITTRCAPMMVGWSHTVLTLVGLGTPTVAEAHTLFFAAGFSDCLSRRHASMLQRAIRRWRIKAGCYCTN